jgi:hypothetical protein
MGADNAPMTAFLVPVSPVYLSCRKIHYPLKKV